MQLQGPITTTAETVQTTSVTISNANVYLTECYVVKMVLWILQSSWTRKFRGPATFECLQENGGINKCVFKEPHMDDLIQQFFGDSSILLTCQSGECLYETEVPGFERPVKKINTPLIAAIIAGSSLFCCLRYPLGLVSFPPTIQVRTNQPG